MLDNFKIHNSQRTQLALASVGNKIRLHFLPPYCPDHNQIERAWKDLHDNVTRNHRCQNMNDLLTEVFAYLRCRNNTDDTSIPAQRSPDQTTPKITQGYLDHLEGESIMRKELVITSLFVGLIGTALICSAADKKQIQSTADGDNHDEIG